MKLFPTAGIKVPPKPREFFIMMPHRNNKRNTMTALKSIEPWWPNVFVFDTSWSYELHGTAIEDVVHVEHFPGATFAQAQEIARRKAIAFDYTWYASMHNDAVVESWEPAMRAFERDMKLHAHGMVLTNYDALAAFHTTAVHAVGEWDQNLPWYLADNDYYRRLERGGWAKNLSARLVVQHKPSQTLASDPSLKLSTERINNQMVNYYSAKWGGPPGHERFKTPWNGG